MGIPVDALQYVLRQCQWKTVSFFSRSDRELVPASARFIFQTFSAAGVPQRNRNIRNKITNEHIRMTPCDVMAVATARGFAPHRMYGLRADVPRPAVCALRAAGDRATCWEAVSAPPPLAARAPRVPPPGLARRIGSIVGVVNPGGGPGGWYGALCGQAWPSYWLEPRPSPGCARKLDRFSRMFPRRAVVPMERRASGTVFYGSLAAPASARRR